MSDDIRAKKKNKRKERNRECRGRGQTEKKSKEGRGWSENATLIKKDLVTHLDEVREQIVEIYRMRVRGRGKNKNKARETEVAFGMFQKQWGHSGWSRVSKFCWGVAGDKLWGQGMWGCAGLDYRDSWQRLAFILSEMGNYWRVWAEE